MPAVDKRRSSLPIDSCRLETPHMLGFRVGMSSTGVIGRKLTTVYTVQPELPDELEGAVRQLHRTMDGD